MKFTPHQVYHIYNQGNNHRKIFIKRENYRFLLRKIEKEIKPYVKFLGYCLMPNHFHWLVYVKPEACLPSRAKKTNLTYDLGENINPEDVHQQMLNHKIGVLLSSYTRAINNQECWSGSLFRAKTKAKNGQEDNQKLLKGIPLRQVFQSDNDYARTCLRYIHQNPVKANMVQNPEEWEFSSALDYIHLRENTLCDIPFSRELLRLGPDWPR